MLLIHNFFYGSQQYFTSLNNKQIYKYNTIIVQYTLSSETVMDKSKSFPERTQTDGVTDFS